MSRIFWFDVETTGLDPVRNDIWSLSFDIEIDGVVKASHDLKMCPEHLNPESVSPEALAIGGVTMEQIKTFPPMGDVFMELKKILKIYIDPFVKFEKLIPAGYNVAHLDCPFMRQLFLKLGDKYYGSWFSNYPLDVYQLAIAAHAMVDTPLPKYKLIDVCQHHGIVLDKAHDARYDLRATRELAYLLRDLYFKGYSRPIIF